MQESFGYRKSFFNAKMGWFYGQNQDIFHWIESRLNLLYKDLFPTLSSSTRDIG